MGVLCQRAHDRVPTCHILTPTPKHTKYSCAGIERQRKEACFMAQVHREREAGPSVIFGLYI
jgi:hypothetical protein